MGLNVIGNINCKLKGVGLGLRWFVGCMVGWWRFLGDVFREGQKNKITLAFFRNKCFNLVF